MKIKFIHYDRDYKRFKKEYDKAWRRINKAGDLILRADIEEFEKRLAEYVGTKYAVALNSGTDAIYLALKSFNSGGLMVGVPAYTFKSTCGAAINAGYKPVIYDLGEIPNQQDINIAVHIAGELSPLPSQGLIMEDACQAFGAVKNPKSEVQCWSFYPAKILGCKGDAGAITTNDEKIYEYVKEARNHFKTDNRDFGINSRMDNLQAALLNIKIQHIDEILARRKEIAEKYLAELKGVGLPNNQEGRVWQDFIINVGVDRNNLQEYLKNQGVETIRNEYPFSPEYPKPPLAAKFESETLRIPCNENMTDKEVGYVIKKINEFFS